MPVTAATAAMSTARPSHVSQVMTSRHPPYVASACETRSREWRSLSKADAFAFLAAVSASRGVLRMFEPALRLPLWPVQQPPLHRPSRDSNVCIYGPSRNDRAYCAPVVLWREQSQMRVYASLGAFPPVERTRTARRRPLPRPTDDHRARTGVESCPRGPYKRATTWRR